MKLPTLDKFPKHVLAAMDVQRTFIESRVIVAAERLQVFRALQGKHMTADKLGRALGIHRKYREAFLNSLAGLGLLHKANGEYGNTRLAEKYFLRERSIYWTGQYSKECVQAYEALTDLENVLTTGRRPAPRGGPKPLSYTAAMKKDRRRAEDFTQMLFYLHQEDAKALAKRLDLTDRRALLDVGGGSGVMSIALAKKNPRLRACVLDLANVCRAAAKNIRRAGLSRRIGTMAGDICKPLPRGYDVVLFCDIGTVSEQLLRSAFASLPAGGLVVTVDRYLSEDRTKPLDRVVAQLVGSSFPTVTHSEMVEALQSCGFKKVTARRVYRDVWAIRGVKPGSAAG